MHVTQSLRQFYNQYITRYDIAVLGVILLNLTIGIVFISLNTLRYHYTGINFTNSHGLIIILFLSIASCLLATMIRDSHPRTSLITQTFAAYYIVLFALGVSDTGLQYTPYAITDHFFAHVDHALGIDTPTLMQWVHDRPPVLHFLRFCYNTLVFQMFLTPLIITSFQLRDMARHLIIAGTLGYCFIQLLYYFFPTIAPAGILHSPLFSTDQLSCKVRFLQIHHRTAVSGFVNCFVSFPSPHVFCAALLTYVCKPIKWLFIPIVILNICLAAATVLLGFHYTMDVVGGIAVCATALYCSHAINRWVMRDPLSRKRLNG